MRSYERSGVVVDQCSECRGVFLDRGELERLIDAEEQRIESYAQPRQQQAPPPPPQYREERYREERRHDDDWHYKKKHYKKKSLLSELFD